MKACKFTQQNDNKEESCFYQNFLSEGKENGLLDGKGMCIMHSDDLEWKKRNNFLERLIEVVKRQSAQKKNNAKILLEGIIFPVALDEIFSQVKVNGLISFDDSVFKTKLEIKNVSLTRGASFRRVRFDDHVVFQNVKVNGISFNSATIKGNVFFHDIISESYFEMYGCMIGGALSVRRSAFHQYTDFSHMKINQDEKENRFCVFENVHFQEFTSFEATTFNRNLYFNVVTVDDSLAFHDSRFNQSEASPGYASVHFNELFVGKMGRVELKGKEDKKMFSDVFNVAFEREGLDGIMLFENVDFSKIEVEAKNRLIKNSKGQNAHVHIGKGCLKYFNQTPLKKIKVKQGNQLLVTELCNTFIEFFMKHAGFNLGVEIVEKTVEEITFFYFSDERIPYQEFESRLRSSEAEMWRLIKIEDQAIVNENIEAKLPDKIINVTDTIINLTSIILKIISRIPLGKISKSEIEGLLTTTSISSHQGILDVERINTLNINQNIILGINNRQNIRDL